MPLYEYRCGACEYEFEKIQKFSDPVLEECPECDEPKVFRKQSKPAFHLKGGGWYKDGYGEKPDTKKENKTTDNSDTKADDSSSKSSPDSGSKTNDSGSTSKPGDSGSKSSADSGSKSKPSKSDTKAAKKTA